MDKNKKNLQIIVAVIFALASFGFIFYVINQLQLNKDSKIIIDSNNGIMDTFTSQFKDSLKAFQNIDSLKLETTKQTELTTLLNSYPAKIENSKNQLKPGINSPSNNNYRLALSKLDSYKVASENLKGILDIKVCLKAKYSDYLTTLASITQFQDQVAKANSFSDSKTVLINLKTAYQDLESKPQAVEDCLTIESLTDLKKSIVDSAAEDKTSIDNYQTNYLDPLIALYTSEDSAKISEFIDGNAAVSVKLKLPSLFDDSVELSIADKIIEDEIVSNS